MLSGRLQSGGSGRVPRPLLPVAFLPTRLGRTTAPTSAARSPAPDRASSIRDWIALDHFEQSRPHQPLQTWNGLDIARQQFQQGTQRRVARHHPEEAQFPRRHWSCHRHQGGLSGARTFKNSFIANMDWRVGNHVTMMTYKNSPAVRDHIRGVAAAYQPRSGSWRTLSWRPSTASMTPIRADREGHVLERGAVPDKIWQYHQQQHASHHDAAEQWPRLQEARGGGRGARRWLQRQRQATLRCWVRNRLSGAVSCLTRSRPHELHRSSPRRWDFNSPGGSRFSRQARSYCGHCSEAGRSRHIAGHLHSRLKALLIGPSNQRD